MPSFAVQRSTRPWSPAIATEPSASTATDHATLRLSSVHELAAGPGTMTPSGRTIAPRDSARA